MTVDRRYLTGFGNEFSSEALAGALPIGQNSPQRPPYGLIPEQLTGSAFTAKRHVNKRSWLYRIRPSVIQRGDFRPLTQPRWETAPLVAPPTPPTQLRWDPLPLTAASHDFIDGIVTMAANGDAQARTGVAIHHYACGKSMTDRYFYNSDGDMLIVPQAGTLEFRTEFGILEVAPTEIAVMPRGVKFQVMVGAGEAKGYIAEIYGASLVLPGLGPIGANGLANPRDFEAPTAAFEERQGDFRLATRFAGHLWEAPLAFSPLDVVAWHGNYVPYKYDLKRFNTINTVSYDHPDPSIFTVLTSPSLEEGTANMDFVIFPPRWMVARDTFRPPYFHRNVMSEYMGLIHGVYDAKPSGGGFSPGGASLHNSMSAHGPEREAFVKALEADLQPDYYDNTLAFMFESNLLFRPTAFALETPALQKDYLRCWQDIPVTFDRNRR